MSDCPDGAIIRANAATDALSAPGGDDLLPAILALVPRGTAWGTPDDTTPDPTRLMSLYWAALADVMAEHYARLHQVKAESTSVTLVASLEDWETELGLPDPCYGANQSVETRLRAVRAKVMAQQVDSLDDIECLASALGYTALAERATLPFRFGASRFGDRLGDKDAAFWVVLTISTLGPSVPFRFGTSRFGARLLDFPQANDLECILEAAKPAEWMIRYDYAHGFRLVTDNGVQVVVGDRRVYEVTS
jgi:uncharacterized protein YmfQ (DUF2313 family)